MKASTEERGSRGSEVEAPAFNAAGFLSNLRWDSSPEATYFSSIAAKEAGSKITVNH